MKDTAHRPSRNNPAPDTTMPDPPDFLSGEALATWHRVAPQLHALGLLTGLDAMMLSACCAYWDEFVQCRKLIADEGRTFTAGNGLKKRHPAVAVAQSAIQTLRLLASEFGMSPLARQRLDVPPPEDSDPMSQFLDKKRFFSSIETRDRYPRPAAEPEGDAPSPSVE